MTPTRYPLHWPLGWKRTPAAERKSSQFGKRGSAQGVGNWRPLREVSMADAVERLTGELHRMGINVQLCDLVISTNVPTRQDGLPYSNVRAPADPGVAVYWRASNVDGWPQRCMAIDIYHRVEDNLAAVAATIEAMRAIERHGGAAILNRAFTGFTALPAPIVAGMKRPWREVLGDAGIELATKNDAESAYRKLASHRHPDKGGTDAGMAELNAARDEALQELQHG
jgi:hypothetical protein